MAPYIVHPIGSMRIALQYGYDHYIATACVLHDVLEDTDASDEVLAETFGRPIVEWVWDVTRPRNADKLAHARTYRTASWQVQTIKACDAIDNLRDLEHDLARHGPGAFMLFRGGRDRVAAYYLTLAESLHTLESGLAGELQSLIDSCRLRPGQ